MAVRVDAATGAPRGDPVLVVDDVMQSFNMPNSAVDLGIGQYAISARGDLVYATGGAFTAPLADLVLVRPNGAVDTIAVGLPDIYGPRLSPTADRIVFMATLSPRSRTSAIFVHDRQRRVTTKVAEGGTTNKWPQWSADGQTLAFVSDRRRGVPEIFSVAANGSGLAIPVVASTRGLLVTSWSTTGVFAASTRTGDIWVARAGEIGHPFVTVAESPLFATFSPDGQWMAYAAQTGNQRNVVVRPYPAGEPAVQISNSGGTAPAWSPDGRFLYFLSTAAVPAMLRVPITTKGGTLVAGPPTTVLAQWPYSTSTPSRTYDVAPDGSLLGVSFAGGSNTTALRAQHKVTELHIVLNFLEELRARVK